MPTNPEQIARYINSFILNRCPNNPTVEEVTEILGKISSLSDEYNLSRTAENILKTLISSLFRNNYSPEFFADAIAECDNRTLANSFKNILNANSANPKLVATAFYIYSKMSFEEPEVYVNSIPKAIEHLKVLQENQFDLNGNKTQGSILNTDEAISAIKILSDKIRDLSAVNFETALNLSQDLVHILVKADCSPEIMSDIFSFKKQLVTSACNNLGNYYFHQSRSSNPESLLTPLKFYQHLTGDAEMNSEYLKTLSNAILCCQKLESTSDYTPKIMELQNNFTNILERHLSDLHYQIQQIEVATPSIEEIKTLLNKINEFYKFNNETGSTLSYELLKKLSDTEASKETISEIFTDHKQLLAEAYYKLGDELYKSSRFTEALEYFINIPDEAKIDVKFLDAMRTASECCKSLITSSPDASLEITYGPLMNQYQDIIKHAQIYLDIKQNPTLNVLSYNYFKNRSEMNPLTLPKGLSGNSIKDGTINLLETQDKTSEYFSKKQTSKKILIEYYCYLLLKMYDCVTPKGKILDEFESTLSKKTPIWQFKSLDSINKFCKLPETFNKEDIERFSDAANLMSKMLVLRDADANPRNYCIIDGKISKIDHDFSFREPIGPSDVEFPSKTQDIWNIYNNNIPHIGFINSVLGVNIYKETGGTFELDTDCLKGYILPAEPHKAVMAKILLEHLKNTTNIPDELIARAFDEAVLNTRNQEVLSYQNQLATGLNRHLSNLRNLTGEIGELPLTNDYPDVESVLSKIPTDYGKTLSFIETSLSEGHTTLRELKKSSKSFALRKEKSPHQASTDRENTLSPAQNPTLADRKESDIVNLPPPPGKEPIHSPLAGLSNSYTLPPPPGTESYKTPPRMASKSDTMPPLPPPMNRRSGR